MKPSRKRFSREFKMKIEGTAPADMSENRIDAVIEIYILCLDKKLHDVTLLKLPMGRDL